MVDKFKSQFDHCQLCGKIMDGFNCSCSSEAMFLFRATQGKVDISSCHVRDLTNDCSGGTDLGQMKAVSEHYGVNVGALWRPGKFDALKDLLLKNVYPAHVQGGYAPLAGTEWDCFRGGFRGGHDIYVKEANAFGVRYADPGANGRYPGCPSGWQTMPWYMLRRFANALPLKDGGPTLAQEYGDGFVYAYIGPRDPVIIVEHWLVTIDGGQAHRTSLLDKPFGTKKSSVSIASYICTLSKVNSSAGVPYWWYRIVSKADGSATSNAGRVFTPTRYTHGVEV